MDIEFDDTLQGLGRGGHRIMIWDGQEEQQIEAHWDLRSRDPEIGQISLLKSETARIENPCLIMANEFGIKRDGKTRSEEQTSELQSLMRITYAVFCLKNKTTPQKKRN